MHANTAMNIGVGTPRAPDFLCIGAQKAATAWLQTNLALHPGVHLPFTKELHYFDCRAVGDQSHFAPILQDRLAKRLNAQGLTAAQRDHLIRLNDVSRMFTPEWYLDVFAATPDGQVTGEFTPRYASLPEAMIDEVFAIAPDVKLIYLIRDPLDRALSSFRMEVARLSIDPVDRSAMDEYASLWLRRTGKQQGDYATFIPRWDARTTEGETMLYLPFGGVKADPNGLLRQVEAYLGLPPGPEQPRAEDRFNRTAPIDVPGWLLDRLGEDLAPHRAFLEKRFPQEFVDQIK